MMPERKKTERIPGRTFLFLLSAACVYWILTVSGIGCPIRFLTGISCAGCGMTRAWLLLLRGDIAAAAAMHPLFLTAPAILVFFLFEERLPKRVVKRFWISAAVLYAVVYLIRILLQNPNVIIDIRSGFLFRAADALMHK